MGQILYRKVYILTAGEEIALFYGFFNVYVCVFSQCNLALVPKCWTKITAPIFVGIENFNLFLTEM
jgi:hypothetical protein